MVLIIKERIKAHRKLSRSLILLFCLLNITCTLKKLAPEDLSLDEFMAKISWRYDFEKPPPSKSIISKNPTYRNNLYLPWVFLIQVWTTRPITICNKITKHFFIGYTNRSLGLSWADLGVGPRGLRPPHFPWCTAFGIVFKKF